MSKEQRQSLTLNMIRSWLRSDQDQIKDDTSFVKGKKLTYCKQVIDAIDQVITFLEENAWRPIESAPKDGSYVEVWTPWDPIQSTRIASYFTKDDTSPNAWDIHGATWEFSLKNQPEYWRYPTKGPQYGCLLGDPPSTSASIEVGPSKTSTEFLRKALDQAIDVGGLCLHDNYRGVPGIRRPDIDNWESGEDNAELFQVLEAKESA